MSRMLRILYWSCFCVGILVFALNKPIYNWDMIPYVSAARMFETGDLSETHRSVYSDLRSYVSGREYSNLTGGVYREAVANDAETLGKQLPFYRSKVLYTITIHLLETLGMNPFFASHFISAACYVVGLWILMIAFRGKLDRYFEYVIPIAALAFGVVFLARLSTPDGLGFLVLSISSLLFLKRSNAFYWFLPLTVSVRPDLLIFNLLLYSFLIRFEDDKAKPLLSMGLSVALYLFLKWYFDGYGWTILFYNGFVERLVDPASHDLSISLVDYLTGIKQGINQVLLRTDFFPFLLTVAATFFLISRKVAHGRWMPEDWAVNERIYLLYATCLVYTVVHFVLWPDPSDRLFMFEYMIAACVLFWSMSPHDGLEDSKSATDG